MDADGDPDIIPLQLSGLVDTDMTSATSNELMLSGLANLWQEGKEGGYAVRHGRQSVRDFGRWLPGENGSSKMMDMILLRKHFRVVSVRRGRD